MLSSYTVTQGGTAITVVARSSCDAICRAIAHFQHAHGGISAKKAGAA